MTRYPLVPRYLLYSPRAWRIAPYVAGVSANVLFWGGALMPFNPAMYPMLGAFNLAAIIFGVLLAGYGLHLGAMRRRCSYAGRNRTAAPLRFDGLVFNAALALIGGGLVLNAALALLGGTLTYLT